MGKVLIVIDMQNDFVTGTLGNKEAQAIVLNVQAKVKEYVDRGDRIIFTRDTHGENYLDTPEGKKLPVKHCINGTEGWQIVPGLEVENCEYIDKPTFGWLNWEGFGSNDEIELVGSMHGYMRGLQCVDPESQVSGGDNFSGCKLLCRSYTRKA